MARGAADWVIEAFLRRRPGRPEGSIGSDVVSVYGEPFRPAGRMGHAAPGLSRTLPAGQALHERSER